jgi:hypothetical protein
LLAHRASVYGLVRKMMQDRGNWLLDGTLFSLTAVAIVEHRSGEPVLARRHLSATIELLRLRDGLITIQGLRFITGMGIFNGFVTIDLPLWRTRIELSEAVGRAERKLKLLQVRRQTMSLGAVLRPYFGTDVRGQVGAQIAILHVMSCMTMGGGAEEYVRALEEMVSNSQGHSLLSPLAVLFMMCSCAKEQGHWNISAETPLKSWETIEFVALLSLAPICRLRIMGMLSERLLNGNERTPLSYVEMSEVKQEIMGNWESKSLQR